MGRRLTHWASTASVVRAILGSVDIKFGSFLKDPLLVLGDVFPDVSRTNMTLYEFNTSHMNFDPKQTRKLDETCLDIQGRSKAHLSNIMDVLGRLTSKLHKTRHTGYICYKNSLKDLKTSWIIQKHIETLMRHICDLVVKRLSHPLTFHFQYTITLRHWLNTI